MYKIKIRYGVDTLDKTFVSMPTIGLIKADDGIRAALGYGDNVNMLINGVTMPDEAQVPNGVTVVVETAANSKAV